MSIEAVRAYGDDLLDIVALELLDVLCRQSLEKIFIAQAPGRLTAAHFLSAQNTEIDTGLFEYFGGGNSNLGAALFQ